jgi:hypothetical protein
MGLWYNMYILDDKKKETVPYDDEMKTYIEIKFVQTIHKANEPITKKIFPAGPCPNDWYSKDTLFSGDITQKNHICPVDYDKIILQNNQED